MFGRLAVVGFLVLWPLAAAGAAQVGGAAGDDLQGAEQICLRFGKIQPPAEDLPDAKALASLKGCDDEALYYGIGMPADPVAARTCAFANFNNGPFSGEALLMAIYANGVGVPRRLDVALGLACRHYPDRAEYLYGLLKSNWQGSDYSWCTGAADSINAGFCAHHDARVAGARRDQIVAGLASRWSSGEAADRFARLKSAMEHFVAARSGNEVEQSAALHVAVTVEEEETLREQFVSDLKGFAQGNPPCLGAEKSAGADARMNAIYRQIQRTPPEQYREGHGTVEQAGIKDVQRAWLRYRDAWVAFVAAAYPAVPKEAVVNWLTLRRAAQLQEMAD